MRKALLVANSVAGALLLTLTTVAATLLYLMFSTGDEIGRREGIFGTLFFETSEVREGVTGASMGVAKPAGLIILFALFFAFVTMTQLAYRGLKRRRDQLLKERSNI